MNTTNYETVIGLEIHAELKTQTKLFCTCANDPFRASAPNVYVCPICLGLPGSLPVMNRQAVEWAALVGLALGCEIGWSGMTKWDRKNYFYPDLPKGYQISQYDLPIVRQGGLKIKSTKEKGRSIEITRIHLEEDTGKLVHPDGAAYSLLDYNRAGVPLLELVTEPVIRSAEEASTFAQMYQLVLRTLGVSDANMEKGEMRVEANISVRPVGTDTFGTKVEVKNLNSFRSVEKAIAYETDRQIAAIAAGEPLRQETRGWDENKQQTFVQRVKETAADYRYFPEPDLPPVTFQEIKSQKEEGRSGNGINLNALRQQLPEMPWQTHSRYQETHGLPEATAERIVRDPAKLRYFEKALETSKDAALLANWIVNELPDLKIPADHLAELANLVATKEITGKLAKELLGKMSSTGQAPSAILKTEGIQVVRDEGAVTALVQELVNAHPQAVLDYQAGKREVLGYLVGQAMAKTKGQADPVLVRTEIERLLKEQA